MQHMSGISQLTVDILHHKVRKKQLHITKQTHTNVYAQTIGHLLLGTQTNR